MTTRYDSVLTEDELALLASLPEVQEARSRLGERGQIYFSLTLPESIKASLGERLGLNLSAVSQIPMRWIAGDMAPHIDRGSANFETTYLVYVTSSEGSLVVGSESYPIEAGTAYSFPEGLSHKTEGTESSARLLIGPMSEAVSPVGSAVFYFSNKNDADTSNYGNAIATGQVYTVGDLTGGSGSIGSITRWRISFTSSGSSPQNVTYSNGDPLIADGSYLLYPAIPCFLKGSTILCQVNGGEIWLPVEDLRKGTLVKTSRDGYKAVAAIGKGTMQNPANTKRTENRLYRLSPSAYPELTSDLILTGCHSILVDSLTDVQRKKMDKVYVTDKKYRLMAVDDERAVPYEVEGQHTIYHFALENSDIYMNYGVFANGGLLVETCSIRYLNNHANLKAL